MAYTVSITLMSGHGLAIRDRTGMLVAEWGCWVAEWGCWVAEWDAGWQNGDAGWVLDGTNGRVLLKVAAKFLKTMIK